MFLKIKHFVIIITLVFCASCKENSVGLVTIEGRQLPISEAYAPNVDIAQWVLPYRERINMVLDSTLAYAPKTFSKEDGPYNSSAGNLLADVVLQQARPIFNRRTGKHIDFVLLNHGGIRSVISKGNVSARTAFEVMPFENKIAVVELAGSSIQELIRYLVKAKRAHPIGEMQIVLDKTGQLQDFTIGGKPFDEDRNYYVATSDYLTKGGDNMVFFKDALSITSLDYLIRNALIDHFTQVDTLKASVDDRFYKQ